MVTYLMLIIYLNNHFKKKKLLIDCFNIIVNETDKVMFIKNYSI